MSNRVKGFIGIVVGILLIGLPLMGSYNSLTTRESEVEMAWAQVENQLQRRNDLIPNLVSSVKGVMSNEQEIFTAIADARSGVSSANSMEDTIEANGELNTALSRLMVSVEAYPELTSNQNVTALMDELAGTENRIATERKRFNESAQQYNAKIKRFPTMIVANVAGFERIPYFEAVEGSDIAPDVNFE